MATIYPLAAPAAASLPTVKPLGPGIWRRVVEALAASRRHQAEREIARYIQSAGGFTDSVEREIERRFVHSSFGSL